MIPSQLDMKKDSVWKIITKDKGMGKVCTKMVPRVLNDNQKEHHMQMCQDIIEHLQNEPDLLRRVILVMRRGFLSTNWKPSARALSERVQCHWGQRMQDSQSQKSKSCFSHSSMWEALSTVIFATRLDNQAASLQRDPAVFALLSVREKRSELWQGKLWLLRAQQI